MDKTEAEMVFATYHNRSMPSHPKALQPSQDDHLLIQPKKLVNPVLESRSHRTMQNELKLNNKLGIDVLNQKSELSKVFQEKRREQNYQSQAKPAPELKSEFDLMLEKRRKDYEESERVDEEEKAVPEFVKMREKLRKNE